MTKETSVILLQMHFDFLLGFCHQIASQRAFQLGDVIASPMRLHLPRRLAFVVAKPLGTMEQ